MYPQLPQQAREPQPPGVQPVGASKPNSTQKLRDEIASLNLDIAERNRAAEVSSEGRSEATLEGASVARDSNVEETEEELPSAPTHLVPARVQESERAAAQYAG